MSLWSRGQERKLSAPGPAEQVGVRLLEGVGGEREWWVWNAEERVGHLRVALTPAEVAVIPPGCPVGDAGITGPERPRTRR